MNGNRAILLTGLLLVVILAVFEATSLDLLVQDRLYDAASGGWVIDRDAPLPKLVFYDAPKVGVGVLSGFLLLCAVAPASWSARFPLSRREAAFLLVCIASVVFTAGLLKKTTGVFGPWKIARYGGEAPYRKLWESIPYVAGQARGRGFPAAHCSGAFALMGLYFVGKGRAARRLGLACGLATGWTVGVYQILKGAHYLSHTLVTMVLAWLILQLVSRAFGLDGPVQGEIVTERGSRG
jgi:membrane-associated PAP2 superfamily phosphatase